MLRFLSFALFIVFAVLPASAQVRAEAPPVAAENGQCFARVMGADVRETVTQEILVRPESYRIEVEPAVYNTVTERVMVREATVRHRVQPAVYETITESVLVEPGRVERIVVPAQFETFTETVIVEPARAAWRPGTGLFGRNRVEGARSSDSETATGDVLCRVMIPAVTETITRSRMVTPPQVEERIIPARFETVERQVVVEPARVFEEIVPAVFEEREGSVLMMPAQEIQVTIPAEYRTVSTEVVVSSGTLQWAEVLCETNTDRFKVAEIQAALTDAGFPTQIDGMFGPRTERAMVAFQRANNLAAGYLTVETTRALSVDPYGAPPDAVYAALGIWPDSV